MLFIIWIENPLKHIFNPETLVTVLNPHTFEGVPNIEDAPEYFKRSSDNWWVAENVSESLGLLTNFRSLSHLIIVNFTKSEKHFGQVSTQDLVIETREASWQRT